MKAQTIPDLLYSPYLFPVSLCVCSKSYQTSRVSQRIQPRQSRSRAIISGKPVVLPSQNPHSAIPMQVWEYPQILYPYISPYPVSFYVQV